MKMKKILSIVLACTPAVIMAIIETVGDIQNEATIEDHEARLAALEEKGLE